MGLSLEIYSNNKVLDITHNLYHNMPTYWTEELFQLSQVRNIPKDRYEARMMSLETHHGTHIDAPRHVFENGKTIDEYPFDKFIGRAVCLNMQFKYDKAVEREILKRDLSHFEDQIKEADVIILNTCASKRRAVSSEYMFDWPYLDVECAEYLWSIKKDLKMVGTDAPSIAANARTFPKAEVIKTHQVLLSKDILIPEELNLNYDDFERNITEGYFLFFPLKIYHGDGSPGRAFFVLK